MSADSPTIRPIGHPGDLGWVVQRHGELYAREFGWDWTFEALVARIVADYVEYDGALPRAAWIAEIGTERVGCVFCVPLGPGTAQLRILLVDPHARGHRLGTRLTRRCIDFATGAGYQRLRLWTNDPLVAARQVYLAAGFRLIDEQPHRSFGVPLIGQTYELELPADPG